MIYGSVCSGVEAATVAWHGLGWQAAFFSDIENFPSQVLRHHYGSNIVAMTESRKSRPRRQDGVFNFGDFTTIRPRTLRRLGISDGTVDLLVGGTPCQDYSLAGKRAGLDGARGNLTLEYARLAKRLGVHWLLWENVPGVFSSNGGMDFGTVIAAFAGYPAGFKFAVPEGGWRNSGIVPPASPDGYGLAWRTLDAQYFGVPQRRRRVFVVGYLGDWRPAAAVLFERESLRGDITPRREAGEIVTPTIRAGASNGGKGHGARSGDSKDELIVPVAGGGRAAKCLTGKMQRLDAGTEDFILHQGGFFNEETAHTLRGEGFDASEDGTGRGTPLTVCYPINSQIAMRHEALGEGTGMGIGDADDPSFTLLKNHSHAIAIQQNQLGEIRIGDCAGTLNTNSNASGRNTPMFMLPPIAWSEELNASADVAGTVQRGGGGGRHDGVMTGAMQVRRLTPIECERLQGFPDDYTLIPNGHGGGASSRRSALQSHGQQHGRSRHALARGAHPDGGGHA